MPKIGMRIMKSSLAVFCCFLISFLRQNEGIVFYSCIAAVLCIQQDVSGSKKVGWNRIKGTIIGGIFGMLVLLLESYLFPDLLLMRYFMIAITIIPIIYVTVLLKMTSASYISCVVFMSVTVSHGMDINPYLFTFNRMLDTFIGIVVALIINGIHKPHAHHKASLFFVNLDYVLIKEGGISSYSVVKLKQLLEQGANIVFATHRSPGTFIPLLKEIPIKLPVVAMNGAALYDMQKHEYLNVKPIKNNDIHDLLTIFDKFHINSFTHVIVHHVLHVYYGDFNNPLEEEYYHSVRKTPYKNFICLQLPKDSDGVYVYGVDTCVKIQQLYEQIKQSNLFDKLNIRIQKDELHPSYMKIEIYAKEATKANSASWLMKTYAFERVYEFVSDERDICDHAFQTYFFSNKEITLNHTVKYITKSDENTAVQKMNHIFHSRISS